MRRYASAFGTSGFHYRYEGSWLGGKATVVANDQKEAEEELGKELSESDMKSLSLESQEPLIAPHVVHNYDGEY